MFRQPEIVAGTLKATLARIGDTAEADTREALMRLDPMWGELLTAEQARIVALLVERVDIDAEALNLRLRLDGLAGLAAEMLARKPELAA